MNFKHLIGSLLLSCIFLFSVHSASLIGNTLENPFPSVPELEKADFNKTFTQEQTAVLDTYTIYLATIDPGDSIYEWFGHTALILERPNKKSIVYDFGVFNTNVDNFYLKFCQGKMYYQLALSYEEGRLGYTKDQDRSILKTELNLTAQEKGTIIDFLSYNATGENHIYLYDFFKDNCATRIRDILNKSSNVALKKATDGDNRGTYRQLASKYMDRNLLVEWTLNSIMGNVCDTPVSSYDAMFLPSELHSVIQDNYPLLFANEKYYYQQTEGIRKPVSPEYSSHLGFYLLVFFILGLIGWLFKHLKSKRCYGIFMTCIASLLFLLSGVMCFLMFGSNLVPGWYNENFIVINPLSIGILLFGSIKIIRHRNAHSIHSFSRILIFESLFIVLYLIAKAILHTTFLTQQNFNIILPLLLFYLTQIPHRRDKIKIEAKKLN